MRSKDLKPPPRIRKQVDTYIAYRDLHRALKYAEVGYEEVKSASIDMCLAKSELDAEGSAWVRRLEALEEAEREET